MLPEKSHKLRNLLIAVVLLAVGYALGYLTPVAITKKANSDAKSVASTFTNHIIQKEYDQAYELGGDIFKQDHIDAKTLEKDMNLILGSDELTPLDETGSGDQSNYIYLRSVNGLPPANIDGQEITEAMMTVSVNKIDGKWQVSSLSIDNNILNDAEAEETHE